MEQKKQVVEALWLEYFNRTLCEKKIITETEGNRMALAIERRKSARKSGPSR